MPGKDLNTLIYELLALKPGEDFALFTIDSVWTAEFVEPTGAVCLGHCGSGTTPEQAVQTCIDAVRTKRS